MRTNREARLTALAFASVVDERQSGDVAFTDALGTQLYDPVAHVGGFADEASHIHTQALVAERLKIGDAAIDVVDGTAIVAQPQLVEADADLKDALVEIAQRSRLKYPDFFERFVLLKVFTAIELLEPG